MVEALLSPLNLFIAALAMGFLLPLVARSSEAVARTAFLLTLVYLAWIGGTWLARLAGGEAPVEVLTAGVQPPFSINLRLGLLESLFVAGVNLVALLGGWYLRARLEGRPAAMSLFLVLTMGIDGMVMTRDLFNLFIFIEITAIATYGLLALGRSGAALAAAFKYIIATSLASSFFLLGTMFLYHLTGTLNLDDMLAHATQISGTLGLAASSLLLAGVIIELKPYPANGWGLDVYQTAPRGVAAMVSVGVSAGAFFALYKVLPLIPGLLPVIAVIGGATFLVSNLIGLKQHHVRRLLGYSSIGHMSLMVLALSALHALDGEPAMLLIMSGLFVNHLLAKAGLFWLTGVVRRDETQDWAGLRRRPGLLVVFGLLLVALAGLPPFPGFWAKWELIMRLSAGGMPVWVVVVLIGSLLEAAYLFRWLGVALRPAPAGSDVAPGGAPVAPVVLAVIALLASSYAAIRYLGLDPLWVPLPIYAALGLYLLDWLPGRLKAQVLLVVVGLYGYQLVTELEGLRHLFGWVLLGGALLLATATLYRGDARPGFYPLLTLMIFSLGGLLRAGTSLEFFFAWELLTVSSYLLIAMGRSAERHALTYLLFSLGSAFLILAGLGLAYAETGAIGLADLARVRDSAWPVLALLAAGFLVKTGALGVHVWVPGAYSESEDDFSAMLSAVVSKAAVFGLLVAAVNLGLNGTGPQWVLYALSWVGLASALGGALMALFQEDIKRLLAYSSMSQVGYIVAALSVMTQVGWIGAGYLTVNHFLFKGLLFLAAAALIHRTGTREMYRMGGLIENMPMTFVAVLVGIVALSGVPPLTGFGGKWLLLNALLERGWYWQAGVAFFASGVAFLYLYRLIHTVFLGQRKREHRDLRDAPWSLRLPQLALIGLIVVFSAYPRWLIDPISQSIAGHLPETVTWVGTTLKTHLGYWDGFLVINIVAWVFLVPLAILWIASRFMRIQRVRQFNIVFAAERPETPQTTHYAYRFYSFYDEAIGSLVRPRAIAFWNGVSEWSHTAGATLRVLYTGNGQTYALYVLSYAVMLYFWIGSPR